MPIKHQSKIKSKNTPGQGHQKIAPAKTQGKQNFPKENAKNHDNIKVTELLSRKESLQK